MTTQQIQAEKKAIYDRARALNGGKFEGCDKYISAEENRKLRELMFRPMIISCLCYGQGSSIFDVKKKSWGSTGQEYGPDALGEKRAKEILREQKAYMSKHATIVTGTYTDHEGCSYNSIIWN